MQRPQRNSSQPAEGQKSFPDKLFYKIGEVSRITNIETYVLRYWETEFSSLKPRKNRSGQRVYVKKDLEQIFLIKKLLYEDKYTIEGVRKRLEGEGPRKEGQEGSPQNALDLVKERLRRILDQLK